MLCCKRKYVLQTCTGGRRLPLPGSFWLEAWPRYHASDHEIRRIRCHGQSPWVSEPLNCLVVCAILVGDAMSRRLSAGMAHGRPAMVVFCGVLSWLASLEAPGDFFSFSRFRNLFSARSSAISTRSSIQQSSCSYQQFPALQKPPLLCNTFF